LGGGIPLPARACLIFPARVQTRTRVSPGLLQAPSDARDHAPKTRGRYYAARANSALLAVVFCHFRRLALHLQPRDKPTPVETVAPPVF